MTNLDVRATARGVADAFRARFCWRYLGFALLVPVAESLRRISSSLPLAIGAAAGPLSCICALMVGVLGVLAVLMVTAWHGPVLSLRAKALAGLMCAGVGFAGLAAVLAGEAVPGGLLGPIACVSYAALGAGCTALFAGWIQAYAHDGTVMVLLYVGVSVLLGNTAQGPIISFQSPWMMFALLAVCVAASAAILLSLNATCAAAASDTKAEHEPLTVGSLVNISFTAPAVGFALGFYAWGVMAVPPVSYTQDRSALVYIVGNLAALLVLAVFLFSVRSDARYAVVRQKAFFLLPVFAIFFAYFAFVRMLGLDAGGELKVALSIGYNMAVSGSWALFIALCAMQMGEKGMGVERVAVPVLLLAVVMYALGVFMYARLGNDAMYLQIVFFTLYIVGISFISTHKASLDDEAKVEKRCMLLAEQYGLSAREREVLLLLASDYSIERISSHLGISVETVRTHKKRIYAKSDVHKHEDLMRLIRAAK